MNLPRPCSTGFLPPQQRRTASLEDYPDRPAGDLYCRIPQDAIVQRARCTQLPRASTRPGKRAPTVKMCESDEKYVPLNDGFNWKGDPNATLSGQDIPQLPPESAQAPQRRTPPDRHRSPLAEYDPATGHYIGPDGQVYTQSNLAQTPKEQTWQACWCRPKESESGSSVSLPFLGRDVPPNHVWIQHPLFADQVALNVVFAEQFVARGVVKFVRRSRFHRFSPARVDDQHEQCDHAYAGQAAAMMPLSSITAAINVARAAMVRTATAMSIIAPGVVV